MQQNSAFSFEARTRRRGPSLTPMVDVVFLLLVFFMLSARFGLDNAISLRPALAGAAAYQGAPRLVTVAPDAVRLNGVATDPAALAHDVRALLPAPDSVVVLRAVQQADLQQVIGVMDRLSAAGITNLVLVE